MSKKIHANIIDDTIKVSTQQKNIHADIDAHQIKAKIKGIGPQGGKGDTGLQGTQGNKGDTGFKGDTGSQGTKGDSGVQGFKGDTGVQGLKGDTGFKGDSGVQGDTGIQGTKGDTGFKGDTGNQGIQGNKGDTGSQGNTGNKGDTGIQGFKGDTGDQGIDGDTGFKGDTGLKGDTGIQGIKGDTGFKGDTGTQGDTGIQGIQGIQGDTGFKGDTGTKYPWRGQWLTATSYLINDCVQNNGNGYVCIADHTSGDADDEPSVGVDWEDFWSLLVEKGDTGIQGIQGIQGVKGDTGSKGDTGIQGDSGIGDTGIQGVKGDTGSQGGKGDTGTKGDTGIQGSKGDTGSTGSSGAKGDTGTQGDTGIGDTGITGDSGDQGDTGTAGSNGAKGDTGTSGSKGDTGTSGIKGDTGTHGDTGTAGTTGAKGDTGLSGDAGIQGDTGTTGLTGAKGDTGTAGVDGDTGVQGDTGLTHDAGIFWQSGFEENDLASEFTSIVNNFTVSTTIVRSGIYAGKSAANGATNGWVRKDFTARENVYSRIYFFVDTLAEQSMTWFQNTNGTLFYANINASDEIEFYDAGDTLLFTSNPIDEDFQHRLELHINGADNTAVLLEAKLDGELLFSTTVDYLVDYEISNTIPDQFGLGSLYGTASIFYYDDLALADRGWIYDDGIVGIKGVQGDTGSTGNTGAKGDTGVTGSAGAKGDTGIAGSKGDTGTTGAKGDTGTAGSKGDTGTKGDTGLGIQGDTGTVGDQGDTGVASDPLIIYQTGFEAGNFDEFDSSFNAVISTTHVRNGIYSYKADGLNDVDVEIRDSFSPLLPIVYMRVYLYADTLPINSNHSPFFWLGNANETNILILDLREDGTINLLDGNDGIIASTSAISVDTEYRIELLANRTIAGSTYVELKINGVTRASGTYDSSWGGVGDWSNFMLGNTNGDNEGSILYFDDFAIAQGDWIGDAGIVGIKGDKGDTGSTGGTGAKGDTGTTGSQGNKGDTGSTGSQGSKGDTGNTGTTGSKGDTGVTGSQGITGDTGIQGTHGDTGTTGDTGIFGGDSFLYKFDHEAIDDSEAITGYLIFFDPGTSDYPNVEEVYVNTIDANANDLTDWLLSFQVGGIIKVFDQLDPTNFFILKIDQINDNSAGSPSTVGIHGIYITHGGDLPDDNVGNTILTYAPPGYKGDTGIKGDTGSQGIKGDTGSTGNTGAKGDTGTTGSQGSKGDTGTTGNTGAKGDTGTTGSQGDTGADSTVEGPQGDTGVGDQGDTGVTGGTGDQGDTGSTGNTGDQGDTGVTGSQGTHGDTGTTGNTGAKGDTGTTGAKGDTGVTGAKGDTGTTGSKGDTGATFTGGTVTTDIVLAENASVVLDPSLSADGKWTGIKITGTAGQALVFGDVIVLDPTAGKWFKGDISAAAGADGDCRGLIGMCVLAAAGDASATEILLLGVIKADTNFPALTSGAPVYASTTGDIVTTQPTTTDHIIRLLGFAVIDATSATAPQSIYFCPSPDYITHT